MTLPLKTLDPHWKGGELPQWSGIPRALGDSSTITPGARTRRHSDSGLTTGSSLTSLAAHLLGGDDHYWTAEGGGRWREVPWNLGR